MGKVAKNSNDNVGQDNDKRRKCNRESKRKERSLKDEIDVAFSDNDKLIKEANRHYLNDEDPLAILKKILRDYKEKPQKVKAPKQKPSEPNSIQTDKQPEETYNPFPIDRQYIPNNPQLPYIPDNTNHNFGMPPFPSHNFEHSGYSNNDYQYLDHNISQDNSSSSSSSSSTFFTTLETNAAPVAYCPKCNSPMNMMKNTARSTVLISSGGVTKGTGLIYNPISMHSTKTDNNNTSIKTVSDNNLRIQKLKTADNLSEIRDTYQFNDKVIKNDLLEGTKTDMIAVKSLQSYKSQQELSARFAKFIESLRPSSATPTNQKSETPLNTRKRHQNYTIAADSLQTNYPEEGLINTQHQNFNTPPVNNCCSSECVLFDYGTTSSSNMFLVNQSENEQHKKSINSTPTSSLSQKERMKISNKESQRRKRDHDLRIKNDYIFNDELISKIEKRFLKDGNSEECLKELLLEYRPLPEKAKPERKITSYSKNEDQYSEKTEAPWQWTEETKMTFEKDKKNSNNLFNGISTFRKCRQSKKPKENRPLGSIFPGNNSSSSTKNSSQNPLKNELTEEDLSDNNSVLPKRKYVPSFFLFHFGAFFLVVSNYQHRFFLLYARCFSTSPGNSCKQSDNGSEGLQTPSGTNDHFFEESIPMPALNKPKWEDLDLWMYEPGSWSLCHPDVQLSASEKKRQNIIYELYSTEKNHVKVLVFLQQAYQVGLRQFNQSSNFITDEQLDRLIPDVLDSLLDFHLNFLRRMKQRKNESAVAETVSDIVEEEFGNGGLFTTAAMRAYTIFCLSRDESCQTYAELMEKNPKFKKFFDYYETQPAFKQHNFKTCFLLIAQRLTKYNLLFDSILKYDQIPLKPQTQKALTAVRDFTQRVDSELKKYVIQQKWEHLKSMLDKKSCEKIFNRDFTYDDLVHQRMDDQRIVYAIGKVSYLVSSVAQQSKDEIELTMVLLDDILVLFYLRNNSMHFYNSNMISSVIPLKTMIVREMERRTNDFLEIMLLCTDKEKPDLCHLSFPSKTELRNWVTQLHSAKALAVPVRYAPGRRSQVTLQKQKEFNEEPHNSKVQEWQDSLQILFDEKKQKEDILRDYMIGRMEFFDQVRAHLKKFPIRQITASTSTLPFAGSLIEEKETRDLVKIKNFVQQKFLELRESRRSSLDSLVERAEKARDNDLQSFFDGLHDLTIAISPSSESFGTNGGVETSTTSISEDKPTSSTVSSKGKKLRRVRTYHGTTMVSQSRGSLRRHTTVPKFGENGVIRSEDDEKGEEQIDENLRKLFRN